MLHLHNISHYGRIQDHRGNIKLFLEEIIKLVYTVLGFTLISNNTWIWIFILSALISQYIKNV